MPKDFDDRKPGRNGTPQGVERIDIDPPYPHVTPDAVERLRSLLASLIARTITDARNKPPTADDTEKE